MKKWHSVSVIAAATSVALFALCPPLTLRGQTADWQLVASNAIPQSGATFASMQLTNLPPLPWNPFPQLETYAWSGAPGWLWVDDRAVDFGALRQQRQIDHALRSMESQYGLN